MCSKVLRLAAVLVLALAAGQTATGALAVEHGGGAITGNQFGHGHDGHHGRRLLVPYPGDWPDSDYDEPTDDYGNIAAYPPPTPAVRAPEAPPACHRSIETFNVPSADGGTRQVTVINCP